MTKKSINPLLIRDKTKNLHYYLYYMNKFNMEIT